MPQESGKTKLCSKCLHRSPTNGLCTIKLTNSLQGKLWQHLLSEINNFAVDLGNPKNFYVKLRIVVPVNLLDCENPSYYHYIPLNVGPIAVCARLRRNLVDYRLSACDYPTLEVEQVSNTARE